MGDYMDRRLPHLPGVHQLDVNRPLDKIYIQMNLVLSPNEWLCLFSFLLQVAKMATIPATSGPQKETARRTRLG